MHLSSVENRSSNPLPKPLLIDTFEMATNTTTTSAKEFSARAFDFVVVGGGTAGLAVAARLAENPALTVGVLEAGSAASGDDIDVPGWFGGALGGRYDWQFETVAQRGLRGRALPWPRGRVLGGTSALNFMTWNRAGREDYDAWEELGNAGWGWESLLSVVTFNHAFFFAFFLFLFLPL